MKTTITLILLALSFSAMGQTKSKWQRDTLITIDTSYHRYTIYGFTSTDTVKVIAYCLIDPEKLKFNWLKLYGVIGGNYTAVNFNGLMIYNQYLDLKKSPVKFKVIYSINR